MIITKFSETLGNWLAYRRNTTMYSDKRQGWQDITFIVRGKGKLLKVILIYSAKYVIYDGNGREQ